MLIFLLFTGFFFSKTTNFENSEKIRSGVWRRRQVPLTAFADSSSQHYVVQRYTEEEDLREEGVGKKVGGRTKGKMGHATQIICSKVPHHTRQVSRAPWAVWNRSHAAKSREALSLCSSAFTRRVVWVFHGLSQLLTLPRFQGVHASLFLLQQYLCSYFSGNPVTATPEQNARLPWRLAP